MEEELDTFCTEHPICPDCGHEHKEGSEWTGDEGLHACDKCGKKFVWFRRVSVAYITETVKAEL